MQAIHGDRSARLAEASLASVALLERAILPLRHRSVLLTCLAAFGAGSGLVIAMLLSRDPREAGAYAVACLMIGGSIALGLRGREVEPGEDGAAEGVVDALAEAHEQMRAVAHDLKAPLLTVTSYLELIADGAFGEIPEDARAAIRRAAKVSERAQTVVDSTLRREALAPARLDARDEDARREAAGRVDLNRTLSDVLGALTGAMRERSATVAIEGRLPLVAGDETSYFRVLENLVQNAIKFCPAGVAPQIGIRSRRLDGRAFEVSISDNGPGMPADAGRLTSCGARGVDTAGTPGHGIGLATVARLVTRLGGTVRFEAPIEGGTVVTLTLPAATERRLSSTAATAA